MNICDTKHINPQENESPTDYADRLGELYADTVSQSFKKEKGQFFTPPQIAQFMGALPNTNKSEIDILDPGCGTAVLSCALIENLTKSGSQVNSINLVVYETDTNLISFTEKSLLYLKAWLSRRGVLFRYDICNRDFVLDNYSFFSPPQLYASGAEQTFDIIISNPPYFKLPKNDDRVKAAKAIIDGQPNIYSIFLALASRMLKPHGELIFIVPRSFTSGRYFNSFRNYFFNQVNLNFIHLFDSRRSTFSRDKVLQETLILKASNNINEKASPSIVVSTSIGVSDISSAKRKLYKQSDLVDLNTKEKIIHLPTNSKDDAIINLFKSWTGSLGKYDIQISTGPVVAYRTKDFIKELYENGVVFLAPLYWIHNVLRMDIVYPSVRANKGQYIQICSATKPYLIPNKNYVFLRRFSSKDDKSRLIAAPYFSLPDSPRVIGVENKLNYIYRPHGYLDRTEVMGIAALLNSNLLDTYFRTFNGNVNVSATELRAMPLPPLDTIKAIGEKLILINNFSIENVSKVVDDFFEPNQVSV